MNSLRQTGSGMFSAHSGRGRPGCAEKRFLITEGRGARVTQRASHSQVAFIEHVSRNWLRSAISPAVLLDARRHRANAVVLTKTLGRHWGRLSCMREVSFLRVQTRSFGRQSICNILRRNRLQLFQKKGGVDKSGIPCYISPVVFGAVWCRAEDDGGVGWNVMLAQAGWFTDIPAEAGTTNRGQTRS
jgi:hypothetical protein